MLLPALPLGMAAEPLLAVVGLSVVPAVVVVVVPAYCEKWAAGECGELWDSAEEPDDELDDDDDDESVGEGGCDGGYGFGFC